MPRLAVGSTSIIETNHELPPFMKSAAFLSCVLMLGIFLLPNFVAGQEAAGSVSVEVTGVGKDADSSLKNALYQAVEQAVGAYVDNETVIKNEEVIHEKLLSVAQGFVEKYEVVQPPRERRDGSGVWETRVSASVKRSEVGAALRAAGVMQVAADGTAAWAEQITRLKSREDAMELLEKLIPEIPRNLFVFSIVGENGELRTVEDRNTGDRLTVVTLRLQSNLDWWHAEALPALEAALNVLRLSDVEPVIFERPNKRVQEVTISQYDEIVERLRMEGLNRPSNVHVLRGFAWEEEDDPIFKAMETEAIFQVGLRPYSLPKATSYFLPTIHHEKITEIKYQLRADFERSVVSSIDFLDASGGLLKRSSLSLPSEFAQSSEYSQSKNNGFFPFFHLASNVQVSSGESFYFRGCCTDLELEFLLPIDAEVLRETKSIKLVPGTFGVSDGPLSEAASATDPVGRAGLAGGPSGVDPALTVPSAGPVPAMSAEKTFTGIGAMLQKNEDEGGATIEGLVVGGPAFKVGKLAVNDRIIGVGQGADGNVVDVVEMELSDITHLIRGEIGTVVRLKVIPTNRPGEIEFINITRDKVDLK